MTRFLPTSFALLFCHASLAAPISMTIDDLPLQAMRDRTTTEVAEINDRLIARLTLLEVPATGFVNESKLESDGVVDPKRVAILEAWLAAGLQLGNHTYSHPDLHRADLDAYLADIDAGDRVSRRIAAKRGAEIRYFRHPYLHTGRSLADRNRVRRFLADHGYEVAPVTIDNSEWIFAAAYRKAHQAGNDELKSRLGRTYVDYMAEKTRFFVRNSRELFDRDIAQVLLIHANRLNADWLDELVERLRSDGHHFVSLDAALSDPAYASKNDWIGAGGISWMHRWALSRDIPVSFFSDEPRAPAWVMKAAGIDAE